MPPSFALGPLSNREPQYQNQHILVSDKYGRLRYAAFSRRALAFPPEILGEIFLHCLPDEEFITPDTDAAPLVLCEICRQWREVALTTPELWSSLSLNIRWVTIADDTALFDLYWRWLTRARSTPLSLGVYDSGGFRARVTSAAKSLMQAIAGLSPQWRNVDVAVATYVEEYLQILRPKGGQFPFLEKLTIAQHATTYLYYNIQLPLRTRQNCVKFMPPCIIDSITFSRCTEILRDTSNLLEGTFHLSNDSAPRFPVPPLVRLRSLTLVSLPTNSGIDARRMPMIVLDCLTAPALKSLTLVHSAPFVELLEITPFLSFASRSAFQLQTLALSFLTTTAATLIQCLKTIPSLVHLKIEPIDFFDFDMDTVFAQFTGHPDFLPKLESLHMILTYPEFDTADITASVVIAMLCYRASGASTRLRSFQLAHSYEFPVFDEGIKSHPEFRRLEEGMLLYVGKKRLNVDSFPEAEFCPRFFS
ncbi:hypothetical protein DFH09DRAFT_1370404 [Mycena vulgaris]|nr:hypothetical protein DFH09DRAFT_1370404 [Mycena vulgaris]